MCNLLNRASYRVHLTDNFKYSCECEHEQEYLSPFYHVLTAISRAHIDTLLAVFDVWDALWIGEIWHVKAWCEQNRHRVTRIAVPLASLWETVLIPDGLKENNRRKRSLPYEASNSNPRQFLSYVQCGHFSQSCPKRNI